MARTVHGLVAMQGLRILVADDDEALRSTLVGLLRQRGVEVTEASSGDQALTLMAREPPYDLVVTDVVMDGPYGTQLAAMARTAEYEVPILVITGHRNPEFAETVDKLHHAELLYKPFDPETFLRHVEGLLGQRGASAGNG